MRGKFAATLVRRPNTRVHVAGRGTLVPNREPPTETLGVHQHGIFQGSRLSWGRVAAQWRYWRLLRRVAPAVVVVHAPELLPLTLLWRALGQGRTFLYDIRENYALNVATQRVYSGLTRRWLAAGLRWVEGLAAQRAAGLLLAEKSYAEELPFLHKLPAHRVVVLENKYQPAPEETLPAQPPGPLLASTPLRLLYSGTISELNGVWEAVALAAQLREAWPAGAQLTIVGFCQQPALLERLRQVASQHQAWLTLIGGAEPVPHARIVAEIKRSHIGLLPYRPHPSTERCRPTKLFEYLAHGLPIIASPNPLWQALIVAHGAGLALDFALPVDGPALAAHLRGANFYPNGMPTDVLWAEEGKKLWLLLDSLV
jgi:glycosyltransferase involved in cell wall biosynthesis